MPDMARDPVKTARRATLRTRRRDLAAARDTGQDDLALAAHVRTLVDELALRPGSVVTSYAAIPGEPPTAAVNAFLTAHGIRVLLPITLADFDLDWHDAADALERPLGTDAVSAADLVLAPGLSVDHTGTRMGQGGGCYDRALPRRRAGVPVIVLLHPGEPWQPTSPRCCARRTTSRSMRSSRQRAWSTSGSARGGALRPAG